MADFMSFTYDVRRPLALRVEDRLTFMIPDDEFVVGLTHAHVIGQKRQFYSICTAVETIFPVMVFITTKSMNGELDGSGHLQKKLMWYVRQVKMVQD